MTIPLAFKSKLIAFGFMSVLAFLTPVQLFAARSCQSIFSESNNPKNGGLQKGTVFDPDLILQGKGVDTSQISFKFNLNKKFEYEGEIVAEFQSRPIIRIIFKKAIEGRVAALTVFEGRMIMTGFTIDSSGARYPVYDSLDSHLLGTGLGSTTYFVAAYILYSKYGLVLKSDGFKYISEDAKKVWKRFETLGFAKRVTTDGVIKHFEFNPHDIQSKQVEVMDRFLTGRLIQETP